MQPAVNGIIYLGIKTDQFDELCRFFSETLGVRQEHYESGFAAFLMPNGDKVEVYGPDDPHAKHHDRFTTGPVAGFAVENIVNMRKTLEAQGIEFIGPIYGQPEGSRWSHFRGPDGNIYEIKQRRNPANTSESRA